MRISEIIETIAPFQVQHVLITGGEPLLQRETPNLVLALREHGYQVSIETHGEASIARVAETARIIMDIKTPDSGMARGGYKDNLKYLKPTDEVKFVIASEKDYLWSKSIVLSNVIPTQEILFSTALPAAHAPSSFPGVSPQWLAQRVLEDRLPVRFQIQLHKTLWGSDCQGV